MKTLTAATQTLVASNVLTLATCWEITSPITAEVRRFTSHTKDLRIGSNVYSSALGYTPGEITTSLNLAVDNLEVEGFLESPGFTRNELLASVWDFSVVRVFSVDYLNPNNGEIKIRKGWSGKVQMSQNTFVAEVRGITERLRTRFTSTYTPLCRFDLGDTDCRVRLSPSTWTATTAFTIRTAFAAEAGSVVKPTTANGRHFQCTIAGTSGASEPSWDVTIGNTTVDGGVTWTAIQALTLDGTVTGVTNNRIFTDSGRTETSQFWQWGLATWLTGSNINSKMEVKSSLDTGVVELAQLMYFDIQIGDLYRIHAGCEKSLEAHCRDKFNNTFNFGGFPHVPQSPDVSPTF